MRITKVKLNNFVCFYDAPEFELGPGINFVVGKNNAGKTTLINALEKRVPTEQHRSPETIPTDGTTRRSEIKRGILIEIAPPEEEIDGQIKNVLDNLQQNRSYRQFSYDYNTLRKLLVEGLRVRYWFEGSAAQPKRVDRAIHGYVLSPDAPNTDNVIYRLCNGLNVHQNVASSLIALASSVRMSGLDKLDTHIFRFDALRPVQSQGSQSRNVALASDGTNLTQVLRTLQGEDTYVWHRYLEAVKLVLPEIQDLRIRPNDDDSATIIVEFYPPLARRTDLAVSLDNCDTGFGQVLAMLYVVVCHDKLKPRIILIDEPNTFLHPGAVRRLLSVFHDHQHHQYIIATHSPTAIMSVRNKRILHVTRENHVSSLKSVNVEDNEKLEAMLNEIGSSRSDIFGMDAYIWVEGKTDKICFDLVMDMHGGLPAGVEIIDLVHTGDFSDKKRGVLIEQIYARLSGSVGILPSVLAFVFDGDLQNDDFEDTDTRKFLPRQNYESYLIVPDILADILNRDAADDKVSDHTGASVEDWIREKHKREYDDLEWLKSVDGAKLLNNMFQDLAGISYKGNKAQYGEEITKLILASKPSHFHEIVDLIKSILPDD